jgi:hypothetical protein
MPYSDKFRTTDNLISHLTTFIGSITDPAIQANYAGFLSVSSVTVFELAIKEIFVEFAYNKHKVLGTVINKHFVKINGRIKISELRGSHIKLFGDKYLKRFDKKLKTKEDFFLGSSRISIIADYGNLITCRHEFVHKGVPTLTIYEVMRCYNNGKEILKCLSETMRR